NYGGVTWAVFLLPFLEQDPFYRQWDINRWYYDQGPNGNAIRQTQLRIFYCPARRSPGGVSENNGVPEIPFPGAPAGVNVAGALGDYASCNGDTDADFIVNPQGVLIQAQVTYTSGQTNPTPGGQVPCTRAPCVVQTWKARTNIASITDGTSNTFVIGEKYVRLTSFGRNEDTALYNGDRPDPTLRCAGPRFPLARSLTEPYNRQFGGPHPGVCQFLFLDGAVRAISTATSGSILGLLANRADGQPIPDFLGPLFSQHSEADDASCNHDRARKLSAPLGPRLPGLIWCRRLRQPDVISGQRQSYLQGRQAGHRRFGDLRAREPEDQRAGR